MQFHALHLFYSLKQLYVLLLLHSSHLLYLETTYAINISIQPTPVNLYHQIYPPHQLYQLRLFDIFFLPYLLYLVYVLCVCVQMGTMHRADRTVTTNSVGRIIWVDRAQWESSISSIPAVLLTLSTMWVQCIVFIRGKLIRYIELIM
jgi:hypothetical protein